MNKTLTKLIAMTFNQQLNTKSFTLLELLIVIGILAIVSAVAILIVNPGELLRRTRDSRRISELSAINRAINLFRARKPTAFIGDANRVYISIPDTSPTCANLGLPALPSDWEYRCVTSANLQRVDGAGWIPVNFTLLTEGSPISSLPIDPINTVANGYYYTYVTGGSWELNALLESSKYKYGGSENKVSTDGGNDPYLYEIGSNLTIFKFERLSNADFTTGNLSGWTIGAGGTTGVVTTPSYRSGFSAIIQGSNNYCNNYYIQDLPVRTNTIYTIGAWVRTVNEVGSSGVGIANTSWGEFVTSSLITGTRDWTYLRVSRNSGSNTTLRFFLTVQWCGGPPPGNGPSGTTYFAEASVMAGSVLYNN